MLNFLSPAVKRISAASDPFGYFVMNIHSCSPREDSRQRKEASGEMAKLAEKYERARPAVVSMSMRPGSMPFSTRSTNES
jgi:hypothetical protein